MKRQTLAETVADIVIGPESSDVLVPRGNMLKIGSGRGISRGMVTSCSKACSFHMSKRKKSFYTEMVEKIVFEVNQSRLAFVTVTKL